MDLPLERVEIGVAFLVAQLVQELHADAPAVNGGVEIEDEHLEQRGRRRVGHAGARW